VAIRTTTVLVDDIDGTEIEPGKGETVRFGLDGAQYEIDLTAAHAAELRGALADYVKRARKSGSTRAAVSRGTSRRSRSGDTAAIREWLRSHGHEIGDRGRIPASLLEEYRKANG